MRVAVPSYGARVSHLFCMVPELSVSFFTTLLLHNNTWQLGVLASAKAFCVSEIVLHVTNAASLFLERRGGMD